MKKLRILLADDSEDVQEIVTLTAQDLGHDIVTVASGNELIAHLKAAPDAFDVVVTDYDMPGGPDGLTALAVLRADRRFKDLPAILHTSRDNEELTLQVARLEVAHVVKDTMGYRKLFEALALLARE
jgi:two-component system, chemotaxis family, CheB/CheR fusion protein